MISKFSLSQLILLFIAFIFLCVGLFGNDWIHYKRTIGINSGGLYSECWLGKCIVYFPNVVLTFEVIAFVLAIQSLTATAIYTFMSEKIEADLRKKLFYAIMTLNSVTALFVLVILYLHDFIYLFYICLYSWRGKFYVEYATCKTKGNESKIKKFYFLLLHQIKFMKGKC